MMKTNEVVDSFDGNLILYHAGWKINMLYWSEECEFRKLKKESGQD